MAKGFEHLRSKRYWALILLGPPLRVIFAYAVFAGLHLGLGLPWPTLEDAGFFASLVEILGILIVLDIADRIAIRMAYGPKIPAQDILRRRADDGLLGMLAGMLTMVVGYYAIVMGAPYIAIEPAVDFNNSFILFLAIIMSTIHNAEQVWRAERCQPHQPDGAEGTSG